ncbi:tripartite tricarboxylate transporter TctB family protein [Candidatus Saccharibacteria bacterium]|nr:tripartite tricarboxylate transporter TctB family protein [Candidatus Saccharibacteria bacterium]
MMNHLLSNLGYIIMVIATSLLCFWQFATIMNKRANALLRASDMTDQQKHEKRNQRYRNLVFLSIYGAVWLLMTVVAMAGGDCIVAIVMTVLALALIIYYVMSGTVDKESVGALKFLGVALGIATGFILGLKIGMAAGTYIAGILFATSIALGIHFIWKWAANNRLDDEEREGHVYYYPPAQTPTYYQSTQQPPPYQAPANNQPAANNPPASQRRHRRSDRHNPDNDEFERRNTTWWVEQLSQTDEGQRELARILSRQQR